MNDWEKKFNIDKQTELTKNHGLDSSIVYRIGL